MFRTERLAVKSIVVVAALLATLVGTLLMWEAKPAEATFPGTTNGKIFFDADRNVDSSDPSTDSEIFTMEGNGSNLTQLTSNDVNDGSVAVSSDGQFIAFTSKRQTSDGSTDLEIYVMKAEPESASNVPIQLTDNDAVDRDPAWSPTGTRLAFESSESGDSDIYVMNTVDTNNDDIGDNLKQITKSQADDEYPAWSPGGGKIAFQSDRGTGGDAEIYVMKPRPEGRKNRPRNLTRNEVFDGAPNWSPSGARIAFEGSRGLSSDNEIFTMKADGTGQKPLTDNDANDDDPVWSPDGSKIAFDRSIGGLGSSDYDIFVMDATGLNQTQLTNTSAFDVEPDWQAIP